jgi:hypothetical protein
MEHAGQYVNTKDVKKINSVSFRLISFFYAIYIGEDTRLMKIHILGSKGTYRPIGTKKFAKMCIPQ